MAVDVTPLGNPNLGMTRAEILEYANANLSMAQSSNEMFYTLLFAYVVAMYLAGGQLTRMQYFIVNLMYVIVVGTTAMGSYLFSSAFYIWGEYSGLRAVDGGGWWWVYQAALVDAVLIGLSIWFGRRIRHPKIE